MTYKLFGSPVALSQPPVAVQGDVSAIIPWQCGRLCTWQAKRVGGGGCQGEGSRSTWVAGSSSRPLPVFTHKYLHCLPAYLSAHIHCMHIDQDAKHQRTCGHATASGLQPASSPSMATQPSHHGQPWRHPQQRHPPRLAGSPGPPCGSSRQPGNRGTCAFKHKADG